MKFYSDFANQRISELHVSFSKGLQKYLLETFCLMLNCKQRVGAGTDLTKTCSLRHSKTFCWLIEILYIKPQAVSLSHIVPKGLLYVAQDTEQASVLSVCSFNTCTFC